MPTTENINTKKNPSTFSLLVDAAKDLPEKILIEELVRITKVKAILTAKENAKSAPFNPISDLEIEKILVELDNED